MESVFRASPLLLLLLLRRISCRHCFKKRKIGHTQPLLTFLSFLLLCGAVLLRMMQQRCVMLECKKQKKTVASTNPALESHSFRAHSKAATVLLFIEAASCVVFSHASQPEFGFQIATF